MIICLKSDSLYYELGNRFFIGVSAEHLARLTTFVNSIKLDETLDSHIPELNKAENNWVVLDTSFEGNFHRTDSEELDKATRYPIVSLKAHSQVYARMDGRIPHIVFSVEVSIIEQFCVFHPDSGDTDDDPEFVKFATPQAAYMNKILSLLGRS